MPVDRLWAGIREWPSRAGKGMGRVGYAIDPAVVARKSVRSKPLIAQSTPGSGFALMQAPPRINRIAVLLGPGGNLSLSSIRRFRYAGKRLRPCGPDAKHNYASL